MGCENKPCAVVEFSRSCYTFVHGEMNLSRKYQVIIKLFNKYPEKGAKPSKIIFEGDIKIKAAHSKWLRVFLFLKSSFCIGATPSVNIGLLFSELVQGLLSYFLREFTLEC